jgi:hypothetical protein
VGLDRAAPDAAPPGRRAAPLDASRMQGVSNPLHLRLHRCDGCNAYWNEAKGFAQQIADGKAKKLLEHPSWLPSDESHASKDSNGWRARTRGPEQRSSRRRPTLARESLAGASAVRPRADIARSDEAPDNAPNPPRRRCAKQPAGGDTERQQSSEAVWKRSEVDEVEPPTSLTRVFDLAEGFHVDPGPDSGRFGDC